MRYLMFVLVAGCIPPSYAVETGGTTARVAPRPANCDFEILGVPPARAYVEVAQLIPDMPERNAYELDSFREAIAPQVCQAGGNAVIAKPTPNGRWTGGSIVAYQ